MLNVFVRSKPLRVQGQQGGNAFPYFVAKVLFGKKPPRFIMGLMKTGTAFKNERGKAFSFLLLETGSHKCKEEGWPKNV